MDGVTAGDQRSVTVSGRPRFQKTSDCPVDTVDVTLTASAAAEWTLDIAHAGEL